VFRRRDDHLFDQGPRGFQRRVIVLVGHCLPEISHLRAVGLGDPGMQRRRSGGGNRHSRGDPVPTRFQFRQLGAQARAAVAVADGVNQMVDLAREHGHLPALGVGLGGHLGAQPGPLRVKGDDALLHQRRLHQLAAQRGQDLGLEPAPAQPPRVVTPGVQCRWTAQVVLADRRERPAATAAEHLAGEQVPRPAVLPEATA